LFMAYQGSITDQFEFVSQTWVNKANSPHDSIPPMGHDPLIGQNAAPRFVRVPVDKDAANDREFPLPQASWVIMTGGGYFFTPSLSALSGVLCQASPAQPGQLVGKPEVQKQPRDSRSPQALAVPPAAEATDLPRPKRPSRPGEPVGAKKSDKAKKKAKRAAPKRELGKPGTGDK